MNNPEVNRKFVGVGLLAGLIGASCCIVPLILLAVGLGAAAATFEAIFEPYSKVTLIVSFVVLTIFVLINYERKKKCTTECEIGSKPHWHIPFRQIIFGFIITIVTYYLLHDVAVPFVSSMFFEQERHHQH